MKKFVAGVLSASVIFAFTACGKDELITKEEFNKIKDGMSYEKVCDIIGGEGELLSETSLGDYNGEIYSWEGEGSTGANANVTFQNGKVVSKAQFGLK